MDNEAKCKCGAPAPSRQGCAAVALEISEHMLHPSADLLVTVYAAAVLRLARTLAGECVTCVYGVATDKAVA